MATRDPEAKRQRLLQAALTEFAAYGIAGARMERIAKLADCSAGLVYTYFGGKDELFEAVFEVIVDRTLTEYPITPDDLPGYAARLFDGHELHPEVARLATWYRLERADSGRLIPAIERAGRAKVDAIRAAQEAGTVSRRFDAAQTLALVLNIALMWSAQSPEAAKVTPEDRAYRRDTVIEAVRRLVEP
ncbi:TetR family transcriptional regulator [Microtetraspora sp. NBRC 13810]|uniref:TetR family transcriptional regulator n=1 Tax=Microtetraspora sp. NBRC 13810 TaxID=3030990 RepID=UPI0024A00646|nr:TetR family transcriptional regulator [Microtetraspora sp. NBRC 13810]GLW07058.1 TetR family transcriptional regulator [Microtetraspora sp. NBRC 13810]